MSWFFKRIKTSRNEGKCESYARVNVKAIQEWRPNQGMKASPQKALSGKGKQGSLCELCNQSILLAQLISPTSKFWYRLSCALILPSEVIQPL